MAKITRYTGNLLSFGVNATALNRTIFGDTTQSDTLDDNVNSGFLLGWEIVGANEAPTKQDFNAMGFTLGQLIAYLYQTGVPEWDSAQEFHTDSVTNRNGVLYISQTNSNTGNDPELDDGTNWLMLPSSGVGYDNSTSGLTAENVQAAIDELSSSESGFSRLGEIAFHDGLVIANNTINPNFQVDIDANKVTLSDVSDNQVNVSPVNLTADITVSGENGLDTGAEANDDWYYLFVTYNPSSISNGTTDSTTANKLEDSSADFVTDGVKIGDIVLNTTDGTRTNITGVDDLNTLSLADDIFVSGEDYEIYAVAALLSTSSTSPTMPSGYTYKGLVGAIYNDSSGNFIGIYQIDRDVVCDGVTDYSASGVTTEQVITHRVPVIARKVTGNMTCEDGSNPSLYIDLYPVSGNPLFGVIQLRGGNSSATNNMTVPYTALMITAQTLYITAAGGTDTVSIDTTGWEY